MTRQPSTFSPLTCVSCEAEITAPPTLHEGLPFCCGGCVPGGPCTCSYDVDPIEESRVRHCLDVEAAVGDWPFVHADEQASIAKS
jgi:hypothetical protein